MCRSCGGAMHLRQETAPHAPQSRPGSAIPLRMSGFGALQPRRGRFGRLAVCRHRTLWGKHQLRSGAAQHDESQSRGAQIGNGLFVHQSLKHAIAMSVTMKEEGALSLHSEARLLPLHATKMFRSLQLIQPGIEILRGNSRKAQPQFLAQTIAPHESEPAEVGVTSIPNL